MLIFCVFIFYFFFMPAFSRLCLGFYLSFRNTISETMHLFSSKHDVNVILKNTPSSKAHYEYFFNISRDRSLLWLMAIVCGLCAGANYYCQPLISSIQQSSSARRTSGFDRNLCASFLCFGFTVHCALRRHAEQSQTDCIP